MRSRLNAKKEIMKNIILMLDSSGTAG